MNATYKIVYNKARGALMVVNEMTSCIRSKGTKTVAAAAVAAMIAGLSGAAAAEGINTDRLENAVVGDDVVDNAQYSIAKQIGTLIVNDGKAHEFKGYNDAYNLQSPTDRSPSLAANWMATGRARASAATPKQSLTASTVRRAPMKRSCPALIRP